MWNLIKQQKQDIRDNGIFLGIVHFVSKVKNKVVSFIIWRRTDIHISDIPKIRGKKCIHIGKEFGAGTNLWIEAVTQYGNQCFNPKIHIGDNVSVSESFHLGATNYVWIGDNVLIGSKCYVTDHNHGVYSSNQTQSNPNIPPLKRNLTVNSSVVIEDSVWIGDGVVVLPGVTIGKGAIIGSNSVVSKSIPPYSIAVGTPAKCIKKWNFELSKWEYINE